MNDLVASNTAAGSVFRLIIGHGLKLAVTLDEANPLRAGRR